MYQAAIAAPLPSSPGNEEDAADENAQPAPAVAAAPAPVMVRQPFLPLDSKLSNHLRAAHRETRHTVRVLHSR